MSREELKARQSAMWGTGRYERIAETIPDIHAAVIERLAPRPGMAFLDLACGTGAVAERAAAAGAEVTGIDLAPALVRTARERAAERGLDIRYAVGDCERLDLADGSFDAVASTCGVMFAPDHEATARELARVIRPGGSVALAGWSPAGGVARMFAVLASFQPAPPPADPFAWGDAARVRELLDGWFDVECEERTSTFRIASGEAYWALFSSSFGPVRTLADSLGDRREELHRAWVGCFEREYRAGDEIAHAREYLLVTGRRR